MYGAGDERCADPRRLLALIMGLPPDSAFARSLDEYPGWTQGDELLASAIEALSGRLDIVAMMVHGLISMQARDRPPPYKPQPLEVPRPWDPPKPRAKRQSTVAEIAAFARSTGGSVTVN